MNMESKCPSNVYSPLLGSIEKLNFKYILLILVKTLKYINGDQVNVLLVINLVLDFY